MLVGRRRAPRWRFRCCRCTDCRTRLRPSSTEPTAKLSSCRPVDRGHSVKSAAAASSENTRRQQVDSKRTTSTTTFWVARRPSRTKSPSLGEPAATSEPASCAARSQSANRWRAGRIDGAPDHHRRRQRPLSTNRWGRSACVRQQLIRRLHHRSRSVQSTPTATVLQTTRERSGLNEEGVGLVPGPSPNAEPLCLIPNMTLKELQLKVTGQSRMRTNVLKNLNCPSSCPWVREATTTRQHSWFPSTTML